MPALLELERLACERGGRRLFGGLSLVLHAGDLLRVHGANGSGKTSLLRLLCGLQTPSEGTVRWRGRPLPQAREQIGQEQIYLAHRAALADELSPLENLRWAQALSGQTVTNEALRQALDATGVRALADRPVRALSEGQRQRCALARLALPPPRALWLLDEPFNALDAEANGWLRERIAAQRRAGGVVVLSDHQGLPHDGAPAIEVRL
ncbi:cytochrome c biogenesis heme-transporting ATPase CcmA [Hydrogenophaga sp. T2]|uniref:cytochrome c biogenesis heme-transporting ATPase CcmA n=1 Tax=Hydrogenophaga sp. T2 TaxID=3132823 RepID=UPI003CF5EAA4